MRSPPVLALLLCACASVPPPPEEPIVPVRGVTPGYTCSADGLDRFTGQPANVDVAAEIQRASGASTLRWTGPGIAVTMDYREDRVNVDLDSSLSRIVRISCG